MPDNENKILSASFKCRQVFDVVNQISPKFEQKPATNFPLGNIDYKPNHVINQINP